MLFQGAEIQSKANLLPLKKKKIHCFCYIASFCPSRTIPPPSSANKPLLSSLFASKLGLEFPRIRGVIPGRTFDPITARETQEFFSQALGRRALSSAPTLQPQPELLRKRKISTEGAKANYHEKCPHSFWCY